MASPSAMTEILPRRGLDRREVAGAFGDIGVLFPIAIALITLNGMNPTAVFLAAGLAYILAGRYYRIPIAVEPFKAVAAIALALSLAPTAIASAGLLMGILLAVIGLTHVANWLAKLFTLPIVRGIQLGLGLLLVREGLRLLADPHSAETIGRSLRLSGWWVGLGGAAVLLAFRGSKRFPAALVLLAAGVLAGVPAAWGRLPALQWGPLPIGFLRPQAAELWRVVPLLVIPQFALTFGNSIVATENTARILYGRQARRVTVRALTLSIALINLLSATIMGSPMCHGSGGITAHYRFGARTERASYVIGGVCVALALFGRAAVGLLHLIPVAFLAVFLIYVGAQHGFYVRDIARRAPWLAIAVAVGVLSLVTTNLTWGFLAGFALEGFGRLIAKLRSLRSIPRQAQ